jgi:N-acetylglucosaminyldiphosphoundecaprenol N-acetyl-beta-D-mannosaminyltransferase
MKRQPSDAAPPAGQPLPTSPVLGTPVAVTTYAELSQRCREWAAGPGPTAIEFANTQVVVMRRHQPVFREHTRVTDCFAPDGMPILWCVNWRGAGLPDRVYGPTFMRRLLQDTPEPFTHYLLGGSRETGERLVAVTRAANPRVRFSGAYHGPCTPEGELPHPDVIDEINRLSPDFIWVGLGTPKQQAWIYRYKSRIRRGLLLSVGFALEVNAGTKPDAPPWMQRSGLTWVFRMASEPRRLGPRYLRYNSLFLFYFFWDSLRRRAFAVPPAQPDAPP